MQFVAVFCWSERRALKALTDADLTIWRPATMLCAPMPIKHPDWSAVFYEGLRRQAREKPPQALSLWPGYILAVAPENGCSAISEADGVSGYLTSNGQGPRHIDQAELEPAILYVWAQALTHIRIAPRKRRHRKPIKDFLSLASLLDQPVKEAA